MGGMARGEAQAEMTPKAAAAFAEYYALGDSRSLAKLCGGASSKLRQLQYWSAKYGWQDRIVELETEKVAAMVRGAAAKRGRLYVRALDEYLRRTEPGDIEELPLNEVNSIYDRVRPAEADAVATPGALTVVIAERADGPQ